MDRIFFHWILGSQILGIKTTDLILSLEGELVCLRPPAAGSFSRTANMASVSCLRTGCGELSTEDLRLLLDATRSLRPDLAPFRVLVRSWLWLDSALQESASDAAVPRRPQGQKSGIRSDNL